MKPEWVKNLRTDGERCNCLAAVRMINNALCEMNEAETLDAWQWEDDPEGLKQELAKWRQLHSEAWIILKSEHDEAHPA